MNRSDMHSLAGAYALDALDDAERREFEEHLDQCADCRGEVVGFLETSSRLGAASESPAPPTLKASVMASVARTRQERPTVTSIDRPSRLQRALPRMALAAAAVALIAGVGVAVVEHNRADDLSRRQVAITQVLSAPDADTATSTVASGGFVRVVASRELDRAVLVTRDLPSLDSAHDYELWTLVGGSMHSAGVVSGDDQGATRTHLLSGIETAKAVAITVEPAGGSAQPTTDPIATLELS